MENRPAIAILSDSEAVRRYLVDIVTVGGYDPVAWQDNDCPSAAVIICTSGGAIPAGLQKVPAILIGKGDSPRPETAIYLAPPVSAHRIIMALRTLIGAGGLEAIALGPYEADLREGRLYNLGSGEEMKLTDKEVGILRELASARGGTVSKQALLARVWAYAEGVETHTIETHIYRLRQKIEANPSSPSLIVTDGEGYKLNNIKY